MGRKVKYFCSESTVDRMKSFVIKINLYKENRQAKLKICNKGIVGNIKSLWIENRAVFSAIKAFIGLLFSHKWIQVYTVCIFRTM